MCIGLSNYQTCKVQREAKQMFVRIKLIIFLYPLYTSFQKIKLYSPGKPTFPRKTIPLKMKIIFQTCMPLKPKTVTTTVSWICWESLVEQWDLYGGKQPNIIVFWNLRVYPKREGSHIPDPKENGTFEKMMIFGTSRERMVGPMWSFPWRVFSSIFPEVTSYKRIIRRNGRRDALKPPIGWGMSVSTSTTGFHQRKNMFVFFHFEMAGRIFSNLKPGLEI